MITQRLGAFLVSVSPPGAEAPRLRVGHAAAPARVLWGSLSEGGFLAAAIGQASIQENRAPASGFAIMDTVLTHCDRQTLDAVTMEGDTLTLRGTLSGMGATVDYEMTFTALADDQLRFVVQPIGPQAADFNRLFLRAASTPEESFFGFGAQLTYLDQKGRVLPILVQEHGVGRGLPIITEIVEKLLGPGSAGSWYATEIAAPQYISSLGRALFLETTEYSIFDMSRADRIEIELFGPAMSGRILFGPTPLDLIEAYTSYAGRVRPLPDWVHEGAIVAVQGGTAEAKRKLDALVQAEVPVAAVWIQDWEGQRQTSVGSQLYWNWRLDEAHYPGWDDLRRELAERLNLRHTPELDFVHDPSIARGSRVLQLLREIGPSPEPGS
jgi:alpha-glucosidase